LGHRGARRRRRHRIAGQGGDRRLGYEEAWVGEHHSAGFEIIASPELFIAAAAERTKPIRLGAGVVSLPYHNPLTTENGIPHLDHQTKVRVMFGVGPVHIAPTREVAWANVKHGGRQYAEYFSRIGRPGEPIDPHGDPIAKMVAEGAAVVGTPDDAIAQIRRPRDKQGEFGVFLQLAHNWADFEQTKKSHELWRRHVTPAINGMNAARQDSCDWAAGHDVQRWRL